jgi:hypothetical protein
MPQENTRKMTALDHLRQLKLAKTKELYPNVPDIALPKTEYNDKSANGLTTCVIHFLQLSGHQAERINTMGRMVDNRKTYTDVIGRQKTIGSAKYIPTTGTKGSADIHSEINVTINGQKIPIAVKWEVKIGKDRQSKDQKEYESKVGNYFIIKSFDDFYEKYNHFMSKYL